MLNTVAGHPHTLASRICIEHLAHIKVPGAGAALKPRVGDCNLSQLQMVSDGIRACFEIQELPVPPEWASLLAEDAADNLLKSHFAW